MQLIDLPMDEEQAKSVADKVLVELTKKIKDDIAERFYEEMSGYLYEHYENNREKIQDELIDKLVGEYLKEPENFKFAKLRAKLFQENKDTILASMADDAIKESVEKVIEKYTHKDYMFEWRWFDGIADFVCANPDLFLNNKRFSDRIALRMKNANDTIRHLKQRLGEEADD